MTRAFGRAAALTMLFSLCAAGTACGGSVASGPSLSGPATVVPDSTVHFRASGFRPGSNLEIVLTPADKGSCCAVRISRSFRVGTSGTANVAFTLPPTYRRCDVWLNCTKVAWRQHEGVVLTASGYLQQATARATVAKRSG